MLEKIESLPDNMIGFTIHKALSVNDYQNVLLPALETQRQAAAGPKPNAVLCEVMRFVSGTVMVRL